MIDMRADNDDRITIRELRERHFLTQTEFAERLGVNPMSVHYWEKGTYKPRARNIRKIAKEFGIDPLKLKVE